MYIKNKNECRANLPTLSYEPACFAAGTLVHTKEGLKPIETIQVGDWVLSKHENGEGEQAYKRVTHAFEHEEREVIQFLCVVFGAGGVKRDCYLIVTAEHPFWVKGKKWKPVNKIKYTFPDTVLEVVDGSYCYSGGNRRLFKTEDPEVAWKPWRDKAEMLKAKGRRFHVPTAKHIEQDVFIGIESVRSSGRVKPDDLYRTAVYNIEVEDFHTYYVGEAGIWVGASGSKAAETLLEKAEASTAKVKPKPTAAPFTINKMGASLKVALRGDSVLGDPNSLINRYKLACTSADYSRTAERVEYHFSELFGGRSGIQIIQKVERPYSRLKLTARIRLPFDCFPHPASLSEQEKYSRHYSVLGATVTNEYVIDESLETHHQRLHLRRTGERISFEELPWYNLQDLNDIKPAIEDLIALALAMGEKCQSLKDIAWLYNSTDPEATRLFTGNIANQDFLTEPDKYTQARKKYAQARSLYLAWRFQDSRFESFCRDYISRWEKPKKREVIETHPYYALPRYAELLRNSPPPADDQ